MPHKQISSIDDAIRNFIETITSELQTFKLALESTFELDSITPDQSLVSHDLPLQLPHLEKDSISELGTFFSPLLPTPPPTLPNNSFPSSHLIVASSIFIPKSPNYHIIPFFGSNQDGFFHDLDWFHWTHRRQQLRNWASFMHVLECRFPPSTCVNHLAPNFKFKQTSTIIQYQREIDLYIIFYEQNKSRHHCTTAQFLLLQGDDDPPPPDLGESNPLFVRPLASPTLLPSVQVWFGNVPHTRLVDDKGGQTWIAKKGKHKFRFSGGGTQFIHGADQYMDQISKMIPDITFGHHIRVVLDVGCGVASCGAYLLSWNVITMPIAPKDVQENQIQFAIECGVPAFATRRLLYPSQAFDLIHCSRCCINWTRADGILLSKVNRMLKAGGYFALAAQPIYKHEEVLAEQWQEMLHLSTRLCWNLVKKEGYIAIWQKPLNNNCYLSREVGTNSPLSDQDDDSDNVWYVDLKACIISRFLENGYDANVASWPASLQTPPDRLLIIADSIISGTTNIVSLDVSLQGRRALLTQLKSNLARTQNQMKMQADRNRAERTFKEGDWVFVKLRPHRQQSVVHRSSRKLAKQYFGPFQISRKIGSVAYEVALPSVARIHPIFHVSLLKACHGPPPVFAQTLPEEAVDNQPILEPDEVLQKRTVQNKGQFLTQFLIKWKHLPDGEPTWEWEEDMRHNYPHFDLEDKVASEGDSNDTIIQQHQDQQSPSFSSKRVGKAPFWTEDYEM